MEDGKRGLAERLRLATLFLADALFPEHCAACDRLGVAFCDVCMAALVPRPVRRVLSEGVVAYALYPYSDPRFRALLRAYKFRGRTTLRESVRASVLKGLDAGSLGSGAATVVPVPLAARRERERGFNQSAEIAAFVSEAIGGGSAVERALVRTRETGQQSKLAKEERRGNVRGAFAPTRRFGEGERVILVDDVITTGETLAAAALALREAGAGQIGCFALAHAEPDGD